jgi:hypothetical protein
MIGQFGFDRSGEGVGDHSCMEGIDNGLQNAVKRHALALQRLGEGRLHQGRLTMS